jgi:D-3-phosphoglycerate dehydrogenase / 2-oxoglutarate reductase
MIAWKILITDGLNESGKMILQASAQVDDCTDIQPADLLRIVSRYEAMIVRGRTKVTADLLEAAKHLKVVGRAGVGVDNIDLQAAYSREITVVNAPFSTTLAVAELTLALLFNVARAIPKADQSMKKGQWIKKQLEGVELSGKTLGIIGLGNIGGAVAQRAQALGMTVLAYDIIALPSEEWARLVSLETLYAQSDFITIHVPLNEHTRGMINGAAMMSMKPGVRLICTARGGIIDESALLNNLKSGRIAAAGLDVFAQEPTGLTELIAHPNVITTPHIGAQTEEAQARAGVDIAEEVLRALSGEPLRWKVI